MKILSFGSLNVDYVYKLPHVVMKGETISSKSLNTYPGGKGLNQSIALGKAGAEVYHAGAIGEDGKFLVDCLNDAGVDTRFVKILPDIKSGHAIIQNTDDGDNCIILYGGANQAITKEQVDETIAFFEEGDFLILQNEINELKYIIEQAHAKGMQIVLNPSPMNEIITELPLEYVNYFLLNEIEAGQVLGQQIEEPDAIIAALAERFPHAKVVLTLGGDGSMFSDGTQKVTQGIYKVKAVDTTAAGDTFTGYFISGEAKGQDVKVSMDLAARAATITVSRPGAGIAIPTMDEVKNFNM